ncbi:beta-lactamase family protein [Purpureocillium lavendulum]|uniref:Beta-lactamase family protein n=1 Tax=Purpureocillium lavendulum TaxID=1247861 RepID=A0AB34FE36_9HYPO|nr:beta-lactamase family protein [Purpureocillium lavendulum]
MSFDEKLAKAVQDGVIPGAVMLATNRSGTLNYQKVLGRRSLKPGVEDPLRLDSVLTIASMTKLLTTIAALQLSERGHIGLDDDVSEHLPVLAKQPVLTGFADDGSPNLAKRDRPITLRHLLTHSSGAGYLFLHPQLRQYVQHVKPKKPSGTIDELFALPLLHQPGEGWNYGSGISWAGRLVEKLTGQTLGAYMDDNIFKPLGICRITFFPQDVSELDGQVSDMTFRQDDGGLRAAPPGLSFFPPLKDCLGGEGAYADLQDYMKVVRSLLLDDEKLLRRDTTRLMFLPQLPTQASRDGLRDAFEDPSWAVGDFSGPKELDWAYGGLLVVGDAHPLRRKGYLSWSGAANLYWFVDRDAGVCGVWGTQVLPAGDEAVLPLISAFEKHVYAMAEQANGAERTSKF